MTSLEHDLNFINFNEQQKQGNKMTEQQQIIKNESIKFCRKRFTLEEIKGEYLLIKNKKSKLSANQRKHILIVGDAIVGEE